jgi:hypothetical protein
MLRDALAGYRATGVPLTALKGGRIIAAGGSDDIGLYYALAKLTDWFHIGLDAAIYVLFLNVVVISVSLGSLGFIFLWQRWPDRIASIVALAAGSLLTYLIAGDVYMLPFFVPIMIIPWVLYFRRSTSLFFLVALALCIGIASGMAGAARLDSALPALLFTLLLFAFGYVVRWRVKLLLVSVLVLAALLPALFLKQQLARRDAFHAASDTQYRAPSGRHVIWHDVYIGLGFLSNPYIAGYCDQEAAKAVRTVSSTALYPSREYESIIRGKVVELLKRDPKLVLFTVFSKVAVVVFMFIVCANVGLLTAIRHPKPWPIEFAFWAAILLSSIAPVLAVPLPKYAISVIAFAMLYSICSWSMRHTQVRPTETREVVADTNCYADDAVTSR